jgi:hypothetical protein
VTLGDHVRLRAWEREVSSINMFLYETMWTIFCSFQVFLTHSAARNIRYKMKICFSEVCMKAGKLYKYNAKAILNIHK